MLPQELSSAHSAECEYVTNTQTRSHSLSSPAPCKSGETGVTWHLKLYSEQSKRDPPCEKNHFYFLPMRSYLFAWFFNDSKSSLWRFVAGCTLYHPVQEITELGLTCIPHTQLGLNWDVPSLTSFLAVSLLMWILIICTRLTQAQLPNSLTRQIRKKITARQIRWHSKRARTDYKSLPSYTN